MKIERAKESDVGEIVELLTGWESQKNPQLHELLCAYTTRAFFENPWYHPEVSPLVARSSGGAIDGFLGLMMRPFVFMGEPIQIAISSNFRVRADSKGQRNPIVALQLIREAMAGPQDATIADGATDVSRRVWQGCGGSVLDGLSFDFVRALRPASAVSTLAIKSGGYSRLSRSLLTMGAAVADQAVKPFIRRFRPTRPPNSTLTDFDSEVIVELLRNQESAAIRPEYSVDTFRWISDILPARAVAGGVARYMVRDSDGKTLGWFVIAQKVRRIGDLAHIGSSEGCLGEVFDAALAFAQEAGLSLLRGPVTKPVLPLLRSRYCFINSGRWYLAHSDNRDLMDALGSSGIYMQMFEGERWMLEYDKLGYDSLQTDHIEAALANAANRR